ncbi:hypothetical protein BJ741DRAFT_365291 [Chytriomyces cf. hyalinus JEL632]|nr:hypothetical protein BJ741DRAFT_365291 [Chytriomyces cf. hyalinus JEL632]
MNNLKIRIKRQRQRPSSNVKQHPHNSTPMSHQPILRVSDVHVLDTNTGRWLRRLLVLKPDSLCLSRLSSRNTGVYTAMASLPVDKNTDVLLAESDEHGDVLLIIASQGMTWKMRLVLRDQATNTANEEALAWLLAVEEAIQYTQSAPAYPSQNRRSALKNAPVTTKPSIPKPVIKTSSPRQVQRPITIPESQRRGSSGMIETAPKSPTPLSPSSRKFSPIPISTYKAAHNTQQAKLAEKERCKSLTALESSALSAPQTSYPRKGSAPTILIPSSTSSTTLSYEDFKRMFPSPPSRPQRASISSSSSSSKDMKRRGMAGLSPSSPHAALERASSPSGSVHSLPLSDTEDSMDSPATSLPSANPMTLVYDFVEFRKRTSTIPSQ